MFINESLFLYGQIPKQSQTTNTLNTYNLDDEKQNNMFLLGETKILFKISTKEGYKTATYFDLNLNDYINSEDYTNIEANFQKKTLNNVCLKFDIKCTKGTKSTNGEIAGPQNLSVISKPSRNSPQRNNTNDNNTEHNNENSFYTSNSILETSNLSHITGNIGNFETDIIKQINKDKKVLEEKVKKLETELIDLFEIYNIQKTELEENEKIKVRY